LQILVRSRRDADIYIQSGTVKVNGIPVTEMGYMVKPEMLLILMDLH
jgi:16S rRNA U516 pseudouridylate synthase RsuA-like enzyme